MPISDTNAHVSVDFEYEWEQENGEKIKYAMKFFHTEQGPIIQISDEVYQPIELPAVMFTEVTEFLVRRGVLKSSSIVPQKPQQSPLAAPSIARKPRVPEKLPRPMIQPRQLGQPIQMEESVETAVLPSSQEAAGTAQLTSTIKEPTPAVPITPEESQRLLQARLAAKAKANSAQKRIKSDHKIEGQP